MLIGLIQRWLPGRGPGKALGMDTDSKTIDPKIQRLDIATTRWTTALRPEPVATVCAGCWDSPGQRERVKPRLGTCYNVTSEHTVTAAIVPVAVEAEDTIQRTHAVLQLS